MGGISTLSNSLLFVNLTLAAFTKKQELNLHEFF